MRFGRAARVILIGAPGVGKGTQTTRLIDHFPQFVQLSSGNLLRKNVRDRTALGIAAENWIRKGKLVPDSMIIRLIVNELKMRGFLEAEHQPGPYTMNSAGIDSTISSAVDSSSPFLDPLQERDEQYLYSNAPEASIILDGFPRTASQATQLDRIVPINMAVNLVTPTDIILGRISGRWMHEKSGRVYNTTFNPPKVPGVDDVTGEPLVRRVDDDPEVWRTRLADFDASVQPLLEHYDKKGVLLTIAGNSSDEITPRLLSAVEKRFCLPGAF